MMVIGKAPTKTPMMYHSLIGKNFTADDVKSGGAWWQAFGLGDKFYSYDLTFDEERGVPMFLIGENKLYEEELLAHLFQFAKKLAEESAEGKEVKDLVVTVPPDANLRFRQAIVAAAEIANLRVTALVHETSSTAVQRAVDYSPEKGATEKVLLYNLGARKTEVTIVEFGSRAAGMVAGKTAPVVHVLASAVDLNIGGHLMDLKIADAMLAAFQKKNPSLADGIAANKRALRKLVTQASKTKNILSANKNAPFTVESLFEDTDFSTTISREEFEGMCKDMLDQLTNPVEKALAAAKIEMKDISQVEVVGGAWRVPKVQTILSEYFEKAAEKKLPLGQHLNGEEAAATGSLLVGANQSSSFRVKKIFFSDISEHEYAVQVVTANETKNLTKLYPAGTVLGGKKKLSFSLSLDFDIKLFEDGVLISEYKLTGVEDVLAKKWKDYELTGPPKIAVSVQLDTSGLIQVKGPTATVEELYWVNETKKKLGKKKNGTDASNSTNETKDEEKKDEAGEKAEGEEEKKEDAAGEEKKEDGEKEEEKTEGEKEEEKKEGDGEEKGSETAGEAAKEADSENSTASNETTEEDVEIIRKQKKKKHEKKLIVDVIHYKPVPLSADAISAAKARLVEIVRVEEEAGKLDQMKSDLEAAIYNSRDKLEREDIVAVSTEEERQAITDACTEYEEWLYEGGNTTEYETRINKLKSMLDPVEERTIEFEARKDIVDKIYDGMQGIKKLKLQIETTMPWVSENSTEKLSKKLTEFEEFWEKKQKEQEELPAHATPAYKTKDILDRLSKLEKEWKKLAATKKPKEPKKPKEKKEKNDTEGSTEQANASESEPEAATSAEEDEKPLPEDAAEAEKELASLREEKNKAVEDEDFDKAQALKAREKKLVDHIAKLATQKTDL
eukprot:gnl/TRDRNA2_/TRDRNA2_58371_c0_seq1.p1 gnl/TRDRNA2_/TRDRNA2_58371_c0~~gnl/TRDRNA2_/TRDRNA2_58371_c0_seq1.p1  ORF type:complete len:945 (+),score=325.23 gnl/TRDRNA2_/TRDRNA2_58371_c0_seq1:137-2836(+)